MKLDDIKANKDNPRLIKDETFKKLVKSISEFPKMMELRPIITDNNNMVLGGNMRLKALKELKFKDIPDNWVKNASELTEEEKKRFIIADNVSFGEWDNYLLDNEWDTELLADWGVDVDYDLDLIDSDQADESTGTFTNNISSNKTAIYVNKTYGIISKEIAEKFISKFENFTDDEEENGKIFEKFILKCCENENLF